MGEEGSKHVLERFADVLARLGGDPRGARPRSGSDESGTRSVSATASSGPPNRAETRRAVTDGGADGAPPGDVPWADDDPIVFGDDAEDGSALLDAVTDPDTGTAPPFGREDATSDPRSETNAVADDGLDPERLDELEDRLEALETDHVQLESSLADVARGVASIREELSATGEDVRLLVAALGGIAIARGSEPAPHDDASGLAAALDSVDPDELETVLETLSGHAESSDGADASDSAPPGVDGAPVPETVRDDSVEFDEATTPEGIHRGAGEPPSPSTEDEPDAHSERSADGDAPAAPNEADSRTTDGPARKLVDPRTEAVGARLRQFREGFVDDPTADLPTGNTADEFRFDKILLPTDDDAAPDLSNAALSKPYLETLPDGYAVDAVVLEWLDWLVSAADGEAAAQAVVYYESIDWLTVEVRDDLLGYLEGLGETTPRQETAGASRSEGTTDPERVDPPAALDLQDHLRSLQYVTELASGEVGSNGV